MNDHTNAGPVLPAVREPDATDGYTKFYFHSSIEAYGLQCWNAAVEQVAGPLRERVAELERENGRLATALDAAKQLWGSGVQEVDRLEDELARLRAENEALRADAERYRTWRHAFREGECDFYNAICNAESEAEHDAAIDAAIAARKGASREADEGAEGDQLGEGSEG